MDTSLFDYELPPELIAQVPLADRPTSRLLVYDRATGTRAHRQFRDIAGLIAPGDLLVTNRSRVIPARLYTLPESGGNACEILYVRTAAERGFHAMVRPGRRFRPGRVHRLPGGHRVEVLGIGDDGLRHLDLGDGVDVLDVFTKYGEMPLPPYITSRASAPAQYQTVFAAEAGSIAAPTAGLHFDAALLAALSARGVRWASTVLHVGLGTFKPIETETIEEHVMHAEEYVIDAELAAAYAATRAAGGKVWACGTTAVRSLESAIGDDGRLRVGPATTRCYLKPGAVFRAVDRLITNFHLPRSTLLVLVAAFAGREAILDLYREAVAQRYRFFSFGDAMVIL